MLSLKWHDPRQAFDPSVAGVDEKIFQGGYQFNELSTGWYPQVVLANESGLFQKSGVILRVRPDGTSTLIETMNATAESEVNMRRFPFDEHRLEAVFEVLGFDKNEVLMQVESDPVNSLANEIRVPQWTVMEVSASVRDRPASYAGRGGIASAFVMSVDEGVKGSRGQVSHCTSGSSGIFADFRNGSRSTQASSLTMAYQPVRGRKHHIGHSGSDSPRCPRSSSAHFHACGYRRLISWRCFRKRGRFPFRKRGRFPFIPPFIPLGQSQGPGRLRRFSVVLVWPHSLTAEPSTANTAALAAVDFFSPAKAIQHRTPKTPAVGIAHVIDPAFDTGVEFGKRDLAPLPGGKAFAQSCKPVHFKGDREQLQSSKPKRAVLFSALNW